MKRIIISLILCAFISPVYSTQEELGEIRLNFTNNGENHTTKIDTQKNDYDKENMAQTIYENMMETIKSINPDDLKEGLLKVKEGVDDKNASARDLYNGYASLTMISMGFLDINSPYLLAISARMTKAIKKRPNNEIITQGVTKEKFISDIKSNLDIYFTKNVTDKRITYLYNNGLLEYILGDYATGKKLLYEACGKYKENDKKWCLNYINALINETEAEKLDITPYINAINTLIKN